MTENFFRDRLRFLRNERKISAREMSILLGQNETYINKIETGKCSTTIASFLKICDFLNVSPSEFFDTDIQNLAASDTELLQCFHRLSKHQAECAFSLLKDLAGRQ